MTTPAGATDPVVSAEPPQGSRRSVAQTLIRGSSWRILAQVMPLFVNLALTPFVITTLGRTGYGLWLVTSTLTMFIAHFDGGIGRSSQHSFAILAARDDREGITRLLVTLAAVLAGITLLTMIPVFALSSQIATFFNATPEYVDDTVFLLRVMLLLVVFGLIRNLFAAVLHAQERFALSSMSMLLGYGVYAAGMFYTLSSGMGLRGVGYALAAQTLVATVLVVPAAMTHLSRSGIGFVPWQDLVDFGRTSWRVQISGLLSIASLQGVILIVGRLRPLELPDFGPGTTFAQQLKMIPMNAVTPIQAMLGRSVGAVGAAAGVPHFAQVQKMWVRGVTGWVFVGAPAAFVGVNVWLPLEGHLAGTIAAIMLVAQWLSLLPQVLFQWLLLVKRAQDEMWTMALTVLVLAVVSTALVPLIGAIGAAIGSVAGYLAGLALMLCRARGLPDPVPSPLQSIPWWQAILASAISLALCLGAGRLVGLGLLPDGGLGLLACGAAAAPALLVFFVTVWGPRRALEMVKGAVAKLSR